MRLAPTRPTLRRPTLLRLALVIGSGLLATGVAVHPQLSARALGEEYRLRVAPVDPIDPFRGAYVALAYPDIARADFVDSGQLGPVDDGERGAVYVPLEPDGDVWVAGDWTRERPDQGPYLACDDRAWEVRCGIESFFLPQDEALAMEKDLADGAVATVRIDSRGNASVVDVG